MRYIEYANRLKEWAKERGPKFIDGDIYKLLTIDGVMAYAVWQENNNNFWSGRYYTQIECIGIKHYAKRTNNEEERFTKADR